MSEPVNEPAAWRRLFRLPFGTRRTIEDAVDDELSFHVVMRAERFRRLGFDHATARAMAVARFGQRQQVRDACIGIDTQYHRELQRMEWVTSVVSDLVIGLRVLRRQPVFTIAATLTLALGIAAASAMFSLVDGILLRPLPFPHPEQLVEVMQSYPERGLSRWTLSQENLARYGARVREFASLGAYARGGATLDERGTAERIVTEGVTANFFDVLGIRPAFGRGFTADEGTPGRNDVAVLSYGFWQARFGGDRSVIGRTIQLSGAPTRIIGIMPADFLFPTADVQIFQAIGFDATRAHPNFLTGVARLRDGANATQTQLDAMQVMRDWVREAPGLLPSGVDPRNTKMSALVTPLRTAMTGNVTRPMMVLQAAVLVILLIAIANVATLVASRVPARSRELAVRNALGATRGRITRQLLVESLTLSTLGGALGIALAFVIVRTFTHSTAISLPRMAEVGMNWRVLAMAVLATGAAGVLFGMIPAHVAGWRRLAGDLAGKQSSASAGSRRVSKTLIVVQIALSFALLVSSGLVLKSFRRLLLTNLGFDPVGVTSLTMSLPAQHYAMSQENRDRAVAFTANVQARVRAIPRVRSAALMFPAMYANDVNSDGFLVEGQAAPASGNEAQTVQYSVTPRLFETLGIPLLYGRDFISTDRASSAPVVIVDDAFARHYWRGAEAVGKRIRMAGDTTWRTIVGVAGGIRDESVAAESRPHTYFPYAQWGGSRPTLVVRATGEQAVSISSVRAAVNEIDPGVPLDNVHPVADAVSRSLEDRRITGMLLGGFAVLAVVLAAIGLYGMMALYVANRFREFGIRLAIGAKPVDVLRSVLGEGAILGGLGVAVGAGVGLVATRWVRALLYDVSPNDPSVFGALAALLLGITLLSCYLPARRAAHSDPLVVLRSE